MHVIYVIVRFFPYFALPIAIIFAEVGWHFKRKRQKIQYYCWAADLFLVVSTVLWFVYRGDMHSDQWVRYITGVL